MNARTIIEAQFLRENGGQEILQTAQRAVQLLNQEGIPTLVTGGLAVQIHGYPRWTVDADIIVPDVQQAHEFLLHNGYTASLRVTIGVIDPQSDVRVDLLPGGKRLTPRCPVDFPMPQETIFAYVTLESLVSTKLGSFVSNPAKRIKDKADVSELIQRQNLPRDFNIDLAVQPLYQQIWDAIQSEPEGPAA